MSAARTQTGPDGPERRRPRFRFDTRTGFDGPEQPEVPPAQVVQETVEVSWIQFSAREADIQGLQRQHPQGGAQFKKRSLAI